MQILNPMHFAAILAKLHPRALKKLSQFIHPGPLTKFLDAVVSKSSKKEIIKLYKAM